MGYIFSPKHLSSFRLKSIFFIKNFYTILSKIILLIKNLIGLMFFMKSAILFSGGKDSTMALNYSLKQGDEVLYLLSMKSKNPESYMFHVPNIDLTSLISEAVGIPLIQGKRKLFILERYSANTKNLG